MAAASAAVLDDVIRAKWASGIVHFRDRRPVPAQNPVLHFGTIAGVMSSMRPTKTRAVLAAQT